MMTTEFPASDQSAAEAGEALLAILRKHIDTVAKAGIQSEADEELDSELWEAVGAYGDALDDFDEDDEADEDEEPDELRFTIRTRYDYTVLDEKAFLKSGKGLGAAVLALLERAGGKPLSALEVDSLETGSGLLTVHVNNEPLVAADFSTAEEPTDLLLVAPGETLSFTLDEPVYESRAEAEAAAKRE
ncbi:MAG: hypothetical protein ABI400_06910 [Lacisediminihabitans sp.]